MTLLAFGGEMGFFTPSDANVIESSSALGGSGVSHNTSFARGYTGVTGASSYAETPAVTGQTDYWLHFDIDQKFAVNIATLSTRVEILNAAGTAKIRLRTNWQSSGADATWQLEWYDGAAWQSAGNFTAPPSSLQTVDIHVICNSATGSADLYLSGTLRISSGAIDLSGTASLAKARFYGTLSGINDTCAYSQIAVSSTSTIGGRLITIPLTGQGATHTFDTGGFANVDELAYSDADLWSSATANQVELCTGTPAGSFTGYVVQAIAVTARVKKSGSGPAQFQFALRSAGTTYFSSTIALDFGYLAYCNVWSTNPATAVAFLASEVAALEYGLKSIT